MPLDVTSIRCAYQPGRSHTTMAAEALLLAKLLSARVMIMQEVGNMYRIAQIDPQSSAREAAHELDCVFGPGT